MFNRLKFLILSYLIFAGGLFASSTNNVIGPVKVYDYSLLSYEITTNSTISPAGLQYMSVSNTTNFVFVFQTALSASQTNELYLILTNHNSGSFTNDLVDTLMLLSLSNYFVLSSLGDITNISNYFANINSGTATYATNINNSVVNVSNTLTGVSNSLVYVSNANSGTSNFIVSQTNLLNNKIDGVSNYSGNINSVTATFATNVNNSVVYVSNANIGLSNFVGDQTNIIFSTIYSVSNYTENWIFSITNYLTNLDASVENISNGYITASNYLDGKITGVSNYALDNYTINILNFTNLSNSIGGVSNYSGNINSTTATYATNINASVVNVSNGYITSSNYLDGKITGVSNLINTNEEILGEFTGFRYPDQVVVWYNSNTRTVRLSNNTEAYWKGKNLSTYIPTFTNNWVSPAHSANPTQPYFLYYNGTTLDWSTTSWSFNHLQVASAFWDKNTNFLCSLKETYGFMDWRTHETLHRAIGTYLVSGGDIQNYAISNTNIPNRKPSLSETVIQDEDLKTTISYVPSNTAYTTFYIGTNNTYAISNNYENIILTSNNQTQIFYNQIDGTNGRLELFPDSASEYFGAIFILSVPVSLDEVGAGTNSISMRFLFIQPQAISTSIETIRSLSPAQVYLGPLSSVAEYTFIGKIIVAQRNPPGGAPLDWYIISSEKLTGNKISFTETGSTSGNFLSSVSVDGTTITGNGTVVSPLSATNLSNTLQGMIVSGDTSSSNLSYVLYTNNSNHIISVNNSVVNVSNTLTSVSSSVTYVSNANIGTSNYSYLNITNLYSNIVDATNSLEHPTNGLPESITYVSNHSIGVSNYAFLNITNLYSNITEATNNLSPSDIGLSNFVVSQTNELNIKIDGVSNYSGSINSVTATYTTNVHNSVVNISNENIGTSNLVVVNFSIQQTDFTNLSNTVDNISNYFVSVDESVIWASNHTIGTSNYAESINSLTATNATNINTSLVYVSNANIGTSNYAGDINATVELFATNINESVVYVSNISTGLSASIINVSNGYITASNYLDGKIDGVSNYVIDATNAISVSGISAEVGTNISFYVGTNHPYVIGVSNQLYSAERTDFTNLSNTITGLSNVAVLGPSSARVNSVATYGDTTGKVITDNNALIVDSGGALLEGGLTLRPGSLAWPLIEADASSDVDWQGFYFDAERASGNTNARSNAQVGQAIISFEGKSYDGTISNKSAIFGCTVGQEFPAGSSTNFSGEWVWGMATNGWNYITQMRLNHSNTTFNSSGINHDITIKKNSSGTALTFDADKDVFIFGSKVSNLSEPTSSTEPARLQEIWDATNGLSGSGISAEVATNISFFVGTNHPYVIGISNQLYTAERTDFTNLSNIGMGISNYSANNYSYNSNHINDSTNVLRTEVTNISNYLQSQISGGGISAQTGTNISYHVSSNFKIDNLSNVNFASLSAGQTIIYSGSKWTNGTSSGGSGISESTATNIAQHVYTNTPVQTLTYIVTNIGWTASLGESATVVLTNKAFLSNITGHLSGRSYILKVVQDGTGTRTLSFGSAYKWPGGYRPVLSIGANAVDILGFWSDGTNLYGSVIGYDEK